VKFEVEQKFRVDDLFVIETRLRALGASINREVRQIDRYYRHPARDFAATDEALRIRSIGDENFVTYKGPKIDAETKTRREIEFALPTGAAGFRAMNELLEALSFLPVASVCKTRRIWHVDWQGDAIEVALDRVDHVGDFVELEFAVEEHHIPLAKTALLWLAEKLGLTAVERRSYLELLLENGDGD
jgi:adenylate cyclase class 2